MARHRSPGSGLAAVWLVAGGAKVGDLAASGRAVNAYDVMPYDVAKVVGAALPFVEIALGLLLLVGLATRLAAGVSAALLVVFIAGIASAWARGLPIDCGCFGRAASWPPGRAPTYGPEILRDVGFLALAGIPAGLAPHPFVRRQLAGEVRMSSPGWQKQAARVVREQIAQREAAPRARCGRRSSRSPRWSSPA